MDTLLAATLLATAPAAPPSGPPATGVAKHEADAKALYPDPAPKHVDRAPNAAIQALRDAEPARAFYKDADQFGDAPRNLAMAIAPAANVATLDANSSQLASIAADLGMDQNDVSQLASFAAAYKARPPTADEQRQHALTAVKELRETYGPAGFDEALAGARALVQRDPRLVKLLETSGLGANPWVVSRLADLARSARNRASLKRA